MSERCNPDFSDHSGRVPGHQPGEFDFEAWSQLAQNDSAGYFPGPALGDRVIHRLGARPRGRRLRQLQNNIDNLRACAGSPLTAAWQITGLMRDHVELLGHKLDILRRETERLQSQVGGESFRR